MKNKNNITDSLVKKVRVLYDRNTPPHIIKKLISSETGWKKTKSSEVYKSLVKNFVVSTVDTTSHSGEFWQENIETLEKPYFNKDTNQYVVFLNSIGRNIVVSEEKHRSILLMYSSWNGEEKSINEICRTVQWPRPVLTEYLKRFGITHDSLPVTDEDLITQSDDEVIGRLKELRKFSIHQKYEKESWDSIRNDASKWREFSYKNLNPFVNFIHKWQPPKYEPYVVKNPNIKGGYSYVVIVSDAHFGSFANGKHLVRGKQQSTEYTKKCISQYGAQVASDIKNLNLNIDSIVIVMLGDIINSANPFGATTKGTPLRNDILNEELFETAFNSLSEFVLNISKLAPKTTVYSYPGNHAGVSDNVLCFALGKYFSAQKNISFNPCSAFVGHFVEKNTFFLCSHGSNNAYKAKAPKGVKLENYIQSLIINSQKQYPNIASRVAVFADLHHLEMKESNDFYYLLAPSMVRGDDFADALSLNSKPAQISLLIDDVGIKAIFNHYFDGVK